ncbi:hypothetical protein D0T84_19920 [Dysgonomonas sp. 521]|uniref:hypothetical protein n=1 Tax=Dysgonomonas sp. 521 TaxID=2302932 RepID=UPI0013D01125|nr:hypothetical protein [Dysgonomonas sp. 521]NDV97151.1 hypothetical protein [Dysgonomonas sp. 521]
MKTIIYYIALFLFLFISCKQNKHLAEYKNVDINRVNLLLDSINNSIKNEVMEYSDSIIKSLDFKHLPAKITGTLYIPEREESECLDTADFFYLIKTIENRNIEEYLYSFERRSCRERFDYTPYALYMATVTNDSEVSLYVYKSLYSINWYKKKTKKVIEDDISLDELTKKQRNLALYYLIKSHEQGSAIASSFLSSYFEEGLYFFPKDLSIAYKLESILLKDDGMDYWPGTDIKIE